MSKCGLWILVAVLCGPWSSWCWGFGERPIDKPDRGKAAVATTRSLVGRSAAEAALERTIRELGLASSAATRSSTTHPDAGIEAVVVVTPEVNDAVVRSELASLKRDAWSPEFERRIYEWQFYSSRIIFWLVSGLVVVGVIFAAVQFYYGIRPARKASAAAVAAAQGQTKGTPRNGEEKRATGECPPTPTPDASASRIQVSLNGIDISSSVLGVVILGLSMGFFYLYLQYVYPIK